MWGWFLIYDVIIFWEHSLFSERIKNLKQTSLYQMLTVTVTMSFKAKTVEDASVTNAWGATWKNNSLFFYSLSFN